VRYVITWRGYVKRQPYSFIRLAAQDWLDIARAEKNTDNLAPARQWLKKEYFSNAALAGNRRSA
jgi:hypothetical protein